MIHNDYISLLKSIFSSAENAIYRHDVLDYSSNMTQLLIDYIRSKYEHFDYQNIKEIPVSDKSSIDRSIDLGLKCFNNKTSGSSGPRFNYKIWWDCFDYIESHNHYRQILQEFGFSDHITTLKLYHSQSSELWFLPNNNTLHRVPDSSFTKLSKNVYIKKSVPYYQDFALSHGAKKATNYLILCDINNIHDAINHIVELTRAINIDIFVCAASCFKMILEEKIGHHLCSLYSQTGETFDLNDAMFAKNRGIISDFCDHMRSWDGGATFLTCKHHRYHLLDNLTYNECVDGYLVSTDFLNIGQPFLRYRNGDMCEIGLNLNKCECGRYYREFKMKGRNPFIWKNISSIDILDFISNYDQFIQIICFNDHVKVVSNQILDKDDQETISDFFVDVIFDQNNFHFINHKLNRIVDLRQYYDN